MHGNNSRFHIYIHNYTNYSLKLVLQKYIVDMNLNLVFIMANFYDFEMSIDSDYFMTQTIIISSWPPHILNTYYNNS